jgi:F0F1-type ATP synthase assembly protein I
MRSDPSASSTRSDSYMVPTMFWPLIGGFIAFVLLAVLIGWILDNSRRGDVDQH